MESTMNLLRGTVTLTVSGMFPERLLNLCAQQNVTFWGLIWQDDHKIRITIRRRNLRQLEKLCDRVGCTLSVEGRKGVPFFLGRFRRRYAFLAGLMLSVLAVSLLSGFVLTVEVSGNQQVPTAEILAGLRRSGLRPGVYGPALERAQIAQQTLLEMEKLSFLTINLYGTRAEVVVREGVQPPQMEGEAGVGDVVATAPGIITRIEVMAGEALVAEGSTISAGEVLIRGDVELKPPKYSELPSRWMQVRAKGYVEARTWRVLTAAIPLTAQVKAFSGDETARWSLTFLGRRLDFFRNSSILWGNYDKITTTHQWVLPGGVELPVCLEQTLYRRYETQATDINRDAAQKLLENQLLAQLDALMEEDGQIFATAFTARVEKGLLYVTLTAECQESIGRQVPRQP